MFSQVGVKNCVHREGGVEPTWADTPLWEDTPLDRHHLPTDNPPHTPTLQDTVNKWTVRTLLDCILVEVCKQVPSLSEAGTAQC